MKILLVNKFLYPNGGSETYLFKVGQELERQGHIVEYFGMEHPDRVVSNRIGVYTSSMDFHTGKMQKLTYPFKIIYSREARRKIGQVLDDFKPDVVHLNNFNFQLTPSILYEIKRHSIPIVYTAHDSQLVCPNHLMQQYITGERCTECIKKSPIQCAKHRCIHGSLVKSILGTIEACLYRMTGAYKLIDAIIAPSEFIKEKLETHKDLKGRILVRRNFVDLQEDFEDRDLEKEEYVLFFGRYSNEKGVETLLRACEKTKEIPYIFAGSGPLEVQVNVCTNVENMGFLSGDKLIRLIRKARFSIFPSECYENCPFSVMESLMCGTPVIASNIGGVPELVNDGGNGLLFEPGNVNELVEKIKGIWENKDRNKELCENCRKFKCVSLEEYTRELSEIYKGIQLRK